MAPTTQPPLCVYGTLLDARVRTLVLGNPGESQPALLSGWERVFVAGEVYPGIRPKDGATINVLLLHDLSPTALAQADRFEGEAYQRRLVTVRPATLSSRSMEAMVYVPTAAITLSTHPWHYDAAWRATHGAAFLAMAAAALKDECAVVR